MEQPWKKLAERVKHAIEDEQRAQARLEAEAQAREEAALAARRTLFAELTAFGEAVGHFEVRGDDTGVNLRFGDRSLMFCEHQEPDRVFPSWEGSESLAPELVRDPVTNRWLLGLGGGDTQRWMPLFDTGLSALLHHALGLPLPSEPEGHPRAVLFHRGTQAQEKILIIED